MKKSFWYCLVILLSFSTFVSTEANAQRKKAKPTIRNTKRKKSSTTNITPVDTATTVAAVAADTFSVPIPTIKPSLRSNTTAHRTIDTLGGRNRSMDKTPLAYENLREEDELYKQVLWMNINTKEKMNLPFNYEADEDNGNQRFINIILKGLKEGVDDSTPLVAFNGLDDRFTTPMKASEISQLLVGSSYTIQVPDWTKDPNGSKGITKDSVISDEFNPSTIETFQIKEEVIFDRKTSRLHRRILGIAPMKKSVDAEGNTRGEFPLFWVYYADLRPLLAKYEAYNPRNAAMRQSWEEVFESHYFSGYIVKSTMNNNSNSYIAAKEKDELMRLIEGDNIKEQIFNFEQSQWSY